MLIINDKVDNKLFSLMIKQTMLSIIIHTHSYSNWSLSQSKLDKTMYCTNGNQILDRFFTKLSQA